MNDVCVVHLVRACNGVAPLINFLESYKLNQGGVEHDLLILFKGFESEEQLKEYRLVLQPFKYKELHVPDQGFDITAYFAVPRSFHCKYYCFLNSFSVILDADWLLKMYRYISKDTVGMVGATGSYQSLYVPIDTNQWRLLTEKIIQKSKYPRLRNYSIGRLDWFVRHLMSEWRFKTYFDPFPNYHIRSNAFILRHEDLVKIVCPKIKNKIDAYKCESGKRSITKQIIELGKSVLVIGKDGIAYEKEYWWKSNTFWQGNQSNLLVSDNQTRAYAASELNKKNFSKHSAWGDINE